MIQFTDDPVRDASAYFNEREDEIARLPVCDYCGEHIVDDTYYVLPIKGELTLCERCLKETYMEFNN